MILGRAIQDREYTYEGALDANGLGTGKAISCFKNGQWYSGDFVQGIGQGYGIEYFPNGERYEGQYHRDKVHGKGTHFYPDGKKITGVWNMDKKNGDFTVETYAGKVLSIETWNNGALVARK
ncbi:hypothetical protein FGO68_gene13438 [Halteria grandinella]|uniref:MORN repeat protein n=1 Tax=Halteria grandinella TaxID=5974 RepID=A0A8J8NQC4_HALGN|nr:hypothetical protein FGO68_gene13438 [Halteria grandinella]